MDPGYKLLQHIKTIPNLVSEEPSTVTPKNTSFMDVPWSDFSKLINQKRQAIHEKTKDLRDESQEMNTIGSEDETKLGGWDSLTGYQDTLHKQSY